MELRTVVWVRPSNPEYAEIGGIPPRRQGRFDEEKTAIGVVEIGGDILRTMTLPAPDERTREFAEVSLSRSADNWHNLQRMIDIGQIFPDENRPGVYVLVRW